MVISQKKILDHKKRYPKWSEAFDQILIDSLAGHQRAAFNRLCKAGPGQKVKAIASRLDVSECHANVILKKLFDLALVKRQEVIDSNGKHYLYYR